jgi:indole-3-glycerol phosphate synthase
MKAKFQKTDSILDDICLEKLKEIDRRKFETSIRELEDMIAENAYEKRSLAEAFSKANKANFSIITEVKKSSPTNAGVPFRSNLNVGEIVKIYSENGATAISVVTESQFFKGDLNFLSLAKRNSQLPILQKDFILDPFQLYEAKAYGADTVLLIASILENDQIKRLYEVCQILQLEILVEFHDELEINRVLRIIDPPMIGINNRDLKTMEVDLSTFPNLVKYIPKDKIRIAESGVKTKEDLEKLKAYGAGGFLIGSVFMRADDIAEKLKEFLA